MSNLLSRQPSGVVKTGMFNMPSWGWLIVAAIVLGLILATIFVYKYFCTNDKEEQTNTPQSTEKRFCKYCGNEITSTPQSCPKCNKKQD